MTTKTDSQTVTLTKGQIPASLAAMLPKGKHAAKVADAIVLHRDPLSAMFSNMDDATREGFREHIRVHGVQEPTILVTVDAKGVHVVDGWHRLEAAKASTTAKPRRGAAKTSPAAAPAVLTFAKAGPDALNRVMGANLHRRHLTTSQKAALAVHLSGEGVTIKQAATALAVSQATIKNARQALKRTEGQADRAKLLDAMMAGHVTVNQANRERGGTMANASQGDAARAQNAAGRAARSGAPAPAPRTPRAGGKAPAPAQGPNLAPGKAPAPAPRDTADSLYDRISRDLGELRRMATEKGDKAAGRALERAAKAGIDAVADLTNRKTPAEAVTRVAKHGADRLAERMAKDKAAKDSKGEKPTTQAKGAEAMPGKPEKAPAKANGKPEKAKRKPARKAAPKPANGAAQATA